MTTITKRQQSLMFNWIDLLEAGGPEAAAVLGAEALPEVGAELGPRECLFCGCAIALWDVSGDSQCWGCPNDHYLYVRGWDGPDGAVWRDGAVNDHWPRGIQVPVPAWLFGIEETTEYQRMKAFAKNRDKNYTSMLASEAWSCSDGRKSFKLTSRTNRAGVRAIVSELMGCCLWESKIIHRISFNKADLVIEDLGQFGCLAKARKATEKALKALATPEAVAEKLEAEKAELTAKISKGPAIERARELCQQLRAAIADLDRQIDALMCGAWNPANDHKAADIDAERGKLKAQLSQVESVAAQPLPATWRWEQRLAEINTILGVQ